MSRQAQRLMVVPKCAPKWPARVGCAGRNPQALEAPIGEDPAVGDAVECYASCENEISRWILPAKPAHDVENDLLRNRLQGTGKIAMPIAQGCATRSRRSERIQEFSRKGSEHTVAIIIEVGHVDREPSLGLEVDDVPHVLDVGISAARSERHHGTFLEGVEPKVLSDECVDHADAVEKPSVPASLDPVAFAHKSACCRIVAITIHDQHGCLLEWGDEVDRRMRLVVPNVDNWRQPMGGELTTQAAAKEVI